MKIEFMSRAAFDKFYGVSALAGPLVFSPRLQTGNGPPCKDPCDFVMRYGGAEFEALIRNAKNVVDYQFDKLVAECLEADPSAHAAAIERAVGWFAQYIHARQYLDPDNPSLITPYQRGAIICRLSKLSGLTVEEVRRIIDWRMSKLPKHPAEHLRFTGMPTMDDPKRDAALAALDGIAEEEAWEPPDPTNREVTT